MRRALSLMLALGLTACEGPGSGPLDASVRDGATSRDAGGAGLGIESSVSVLEVVFTPPPGEDPTHWTGWTLGGRPAAGVLRLGAEWMVLRDPVDDPWVIPNPRPGYYEVRATTGGGRAVAFGPVRFVTDSRMLSGAPVWAVGTDRLMAVRGTAATGPQVRVYDRAGRELDVRLFNGLRGGFYDQGGRGIWGARGSGSETRVVLHTPDGARERVYPGRTFLFSRGATDGGLLVESETGLFEARLDGTERALPFLWGAPLQMVGVVGARFCGRVPSVAAVACLDADGVERARTTVGDEVLSWGGGAAVLPDGSVLIRRSAEPGTWHAWNPSTGATRVHQTGAVHGGGAANELFYRDFEGALWSQGDLNEFYRHDAAGATRYVLTVPGELYEGLESGGSTPPRILRAWPSADVVYIHVQYSNTNLPPVNAYTRVPRSRLVESPRP